MRWTPKESTIIGNHSYLKVSRVGIAGYFLLAVLPLNLQLPMKILAGRIFLMPVVMPTSCSKCCMKELMLALAAEYIMYLRLSRRDNYCTMTGEKFVFMNTSFGF